MAGAVSNMYIGIHFSFLCWQSEEYYLQKVERVLAICSSANSMELSGVTVCQSSLYLSVGTVYLRFLQMVFFMLASQLICVTECSLFITFVHLLKKSIMI
jgi:hypothetical protein